MTNFNSGKNLLVISLFSDSFLQFKANFGGKKINPCHGMVALVRTVPLHIGKRYTYNWVSNDIVVTLVSLILSFQILFLRFINKNVFATKELFMSVYSNVKKSNSTSYTRVQRPKTIAQNSYHM